MRDSRHCLLLRLALLLLVAGLAQAQTLAHKNWAGSGITVETWWSGAILYQIDPLSFQDSDGDGFGDLRGITQRLDYLQSLSVDAIVLSPFQLQPEFGRNAGGPPFDPRFGSEQDLDQLIQEATRRKQRIFVDLPLDATLTAQEQLNAARFWLSRGIAGLRITAGDSAHPLPLAQRSERMRELHRLTATFAGQRVLLRDLPDVAAASRPPARDRRSSSNRRHTPAFALASDLAQLAVDRGLLLMPRLSPADLRRALATPATTSQPSPQSDAPDHARSFDRFGDSGGNTAQAKLLAVALLAARGAPSIYFGQEIGMATTPAPRTAAHPDVDPTPMQWGSGRGFTSGIPWMELGRNAQTANVELEDSDADSLLNWYRRLGALRHANPALRSGALELVARSNPDIVAWVRRMPASAAAAAPVLVVCNLSAHSAVLSLGSDLRQIGLLTSSPTMRTLLSYPSPANGSANTAGQASVFLSYNNLVLPPFGIYIGELARQPGLETSPAPAHRRNSR